MTMRVTLPPFRQDRVAAIGVELEELREEAYLTDDPLLPVLDEATRLLRRHSDSGDTSANSYRALKERVWRELHLTYARDLENTQRQHDAFVGGDPRRA
jgi:hypothetical protein